MSTRAALFEVVGRRSGPTGGADDADDTRRRHEPQSFHERRRDPRADEFPSSDSTGDEEPKFDSGSSDGEPEPESEPELPLAFFATLELLVAREAGHWRSVEMRAAAIRSPFVKP